MDNPYQSPETIDDNQITWPQWIKAWIMHLVLIPLFLYWPCLICFLVATMVDVERDAYQKYAIVPFCTLGVLSQVFWHFAMVNDWLHQRGNNA
jgi:hypothetical protein